jgi:methyl-galactoside transport system substrate-binding protein
MKKFAILSIALAVICTGAFAQAKIGVSIYKFDDTFMSGVRNSIETAAKAASVTVSVQDGQGDQSKQNDSVDLFLTQGYNSLAINMVEPASANVLIKKAAAKKIPLVLFNREPGDLDLAKFPGVYYVGAKAQESGTMQGQIAVNYWKKSAKAGQVMNYVMLEGDPANSDAKYRTEFSIKAVTAAGIKVNELAIDTAMWNRGDAQNKMQAWLAKFGGKIDFVFANNDDMALGAIEALKAAGYFVGNKYMPVVGVDATDAGKDALKQGTLLGTVLNDGINQGKATYDLAAQLGAGAKTLKTVAPLADKDGKADPNGHYVWVPYQMVTK